MSDGEASGQGQDTHRPRERAGRWLRTALVVLALAVIGSLGGVTTTILWPTTLQTRHFEASVQVSPSVLQASTVHVPTVFGDLNIQFDGRPLAAPGIEAHVQVREEITELFTSGRVDVEELAPDPDELRSVMQEGVVTLGLKFALGIIATQALVVGLWMVGRHEQPWRGSAGMVAGATALALGVPAVGSAVTYRAENYAEFSATSLLGTVRQNSGMFADIQGAARAATPYVQNLLLLSDALHNEFVPDEAVMEPAARFLLVSDIHGMNYYPLMEQIIAEEDITAVIDTGDLVNFGTVAEGEMAGIFRSIEELGVPYIFVRGNHDATRPGDEALLRRMAQIPNVILLEPTDGEYVEARVAGVRITGFNDWRYFGEVGDTDFGQQQRDAAARYAEASRGWPEPDILLSHQPFALRPLDTGRLKINGHMHAAALEGDNHITVGTFTGGGLVNHFQVPGDEDEDTAGELVGQPYAFDILSFGADCSVQTLTRYTYRNLVSGRPQFDNVSVINGARLAEPPPEEEGRTCGPELGLATTPIVPIEEDTDEGEAGDEGADEPFAP